MARKRLSGLSQGPLVGVVRLSLLNDHPRGQGPPLEARSMPHESPRARGVNVARVMTDNGCGYISRVFARTMEAVGARNLRIRPYTPNTNGKDERFIQTLTRAWAYAFAYPSTAARAADLPRWLAGYNHERPHGSLGRRPAVSRPEQRSRKPHRAL